jgi:hypothetical protein
MKIKSLFLISIIAVALPVVSLAQTTLIAQGDAMTSCSMPINPTSATDWTSTVSCLQGRISMLWQAINKIESRLNALESRAIPGGSTPVPVPSYPINNPNAPIGVPAVPTTNKPIPIDNGGVMIPVPTSAQNSAVDYNQMLQSGASNDSVKAVQNFLKVQGLFTAPQATGYFGDVTKNAVLKFQAAQGLTQTGSINNQTLQKMKAIAPQAAPSVNASIQQIQPSQVKAQ